MSISSLPYESPQETLAPPKAVTRSVAVVPLNGATRSRKAPPNAKPTPWVPVWRIWLSCLAAAVLLIGFSPVILVCYVLVRLTSPGPGFYRQTRLGLYGEPFQLIKLRTMTVDAESGTGAVWAVKNDPRVTPIGSWLRRSHLDELPQLVNVLLGEMGFIGPRPERPEIAARLVEQIPEYHERLNVRPGISGLAQINLPPDSDLDSVRRKLALDREYVATSSLRLDLCLVLATVPHALGIHSKVINRLLGVHRPFEPLLNGPSSAHAVASLAAPINRRHESVDLAVIRVQEYFDEAMENINAADAAFNRLCATVSALSPTHAATSTQTMLDVARRLRETLVEQEIVLLHSLLRTGLDDRAGAMPQHLK